MQSVLRNETIKVCPGPGATEESSIAGLHSVHAVSRHIRPLQCHCQEGRSRPIHHRLLQVSRDTPSINLNSHLQTRGGYFKIYNIHFNINIFLYKDPFPKNKRLLLIVRSVFGASNLLIIFYGLKHMPMADVNMISAGSPIWVVIFARIFLKEPLMVFDIINVFVTLLGILFIIR